MPKPQLTDVPLFSEKGVIPSGSSAGATKVSKSITTPSTKSLPQTTPLSIPCQSKRKRFPKRPLCVDDISPPLISNPFNELDTSTSHLSHSSSKPEHDSLR